MLEASPGLPAESCAEAATPASTRCVAWCAAAPIVAALFDEMLGFGRDVYWMLLLSPELKILRELAGAPYNFNGVRYQDVLADGGQLLDAGRGSDAVQGVGLDGGELGVHGAWTDGSSPGGPVRTADPRRVWSIIGPPPSPFACAASS